MAEERLLLTPFTNFSNYDFNLSSPFVRTGISKDDGGSGLAKGGAYGTGNHGNDVYSSDDGSDSSEWGACRDWQDAQHTLFQLANLCAAVSLLTPSSFRHHLLFLRCLFLVAFFFFVLWAGLFVCMLDVLVWNCLFFLVDLVHIVCLVYSNIPSRFNPSLCELYAKRFKPLKVCRTDFAELCSLANIVPLRKGMRYAVEGLTPCGEKVSMLLRGRLKVSHEGVFLHSVEPNEFVDSPEFDSVPFQGETSEKFQVTIVASEDSLVLSWLYPNMRSFLASNPFMWNVFTNSVGKDVSDKLYRLQEHLVRVPEGQLPCLTRNSSMVNVRKCLLSPEDGQACFTNASKRLPELAVSGPQMVTATVETSV